MGVSRPCDVGHRTDDELSRSGWIIGTDATTGQVVSTFSTQAGAYAGTGSGVWQAGGALAYDGTNMYFVTGNGFGEELGGSPRLGRNPPGALAMAVTRISIDPQTKNITATDFFVPSDYRAIDAADQDFGSSGVCLLPTGFGSGSVRRLAIANGKNSKAYIMNADNLGGYRTGSGGGDGNLQTIPLGGQTFATAGGYPLEGGYVYISAVNSPTIALKFGQDSNGNPLFTQAGQTADVAPNIRGTGHTTVTSNNGQAGTGLLWVTDTQNGNIRVYPAVPPANGTMSHIFYATVPTGGLKYSRVVPGMGRMFVASTAASITAYGAPINLPLNCTTSLPFPRTIVNQTSTVQVTCQATIATQITAVSPSDATIKTQGFPALPYSMSASSTLVFNTTWTPTTPGTFAYTVTVTTNNGVNGYVTSVPISFTGQSVTSGPSFQLVPTNLAFGGLVPNASDTIGGLNKSITLSNLGLATLTVTSWDFDEHYSTGDENDGDDDDDDDDNLQDTDGTHDNKTVTPSFILYGMPSTIANQSSVTLTINYNPKKNGNYVGILVVYTNGGTSTVIITGTAAGPAELHYTTQQYDGRVLSDTPYMDFGISLAGTKQILVLNVTNTGESVLTLTKSKPPVGPLIYPLNGDSDLTEGLNIAANQSAQGPVELFSPTSQVNIPAANTSAMWVLNANGDNPAVRFIQMSGRVVTRQLGPLLNTTDFGDANGTARYKYLGCYTETLDQRTFAQSSGLSTSSVETGSCATAAAASAGDGNFFGTEYGQECWFRSTPPTTTLVSDDPCNMPCSADSTQYCGGQGGYMSVFYDSLAYNATSKTFLPGAFTGTQTVMSTGNWNSLGCYTDAQNGRALAGATFTDTKNMTVELCTAYCQSKGFSFAGVEYSQECYCDNSLASTSQSNATGCTMVCKGSKAEYCGGSSRLNVYALNTTASSTSTSTSLSSTAVVSTTSTTASPTTIPATTSSTTTSTTSTSSSTTAATSSSTTTTSSSTTTTSSSTTSAPTSTATSDYRGCYHEPPNGRALKNVLTVKNNTGPNCLAACKAAGYTIAGAEYSSECYCDTILSANTYQVADSQCSMACSGDATQTCGGSYLLSVYSSSVASPLPIAAQPTIPTTVNGNYSLFGCISDSTASRTFSAKAPNLGNANTLEACATACAGYTFFGTEYSNECYCDNTPRAGYTNSTLSQCNMACSGNTTEYCGAGNLLTAYVFNSTLAAAQKGPVVASSSTTTASTSSTTTSSTTTSTTTTSTTTTSTTTTSSTPKPSTSSTTTTSATLTSATTSSTPTATSTKTTSTTPSTSSTSTTTSITKPASTTTTTTTTSATAAPSTTKSTSTSTTSSTSTSSSSTAPMPTGFNALGCYLDSQGSRTLATLAYSNSSNTPALCATACRRNGYRYAGVEYGNECYCSNFLQNPGLNGGSANSGCTTACAGDQTQTCGGSSRLYIYEDKTWKQTFFTVQRAARWNFTDCVVDSGNPRTLNVTLAGGSKMTVESCLASCEAKSLVACGMEYSGECYGSQVMPNVTSAPSNGNADPLTRGCSMPCNGNATIACGGASRLNLYAFLNGTTPVSPSTLQLSK